jgi:glutathione-regulated potassium-efflux system protein KefB
MQGHPVTEVTLTEIAVLLAALAIAAPLAKWLGIGTVLGYLSAGVLLGPYGVQRVFSATEAKELLHFAEFGVVLLLFLIGLELKPKRLWAMRSSIFGLGGAQVGLTAAVLALAGSALGLAPLTALFIGLVLALSSTAFALQVLEETGELSARHGRLAFAVLLFQDLAAIPLIALAPLFAVSAGSSASQMDLLAAAKALAVIAGVVVVGRFALDPILRLVARANVKEAMTAAALLLVIVVTLVMQAAGLSASLGAFLAGALLAESSYRHELEADIQPFQGLLLGLFFTAIGMSLNLLLLWQSPLLVLALVAGLVAIKTVVLAGLGIWREELAPRPARRLGLSLSQGGEFAFLLLTTGVAAGVLARGQADLLNVVVTLSMVATPPLLFAEKWLTGTKAASQPVYDTPPENDGHVIIAGYGRVGQVISRVLRARKIPFTALDISSEQIEFVKKFGAQAFFGDASRLDILEAAQAGKARAFVLAIDDIEASMRTAEIVRRHYPKLPVFARARNRTHAHRLLDLGITNVHRETFHSSLVMTRQVLLGLGISDREAKSLVETFKGHDERRLIEDYNQYTDLEKLQEKARSDAARLEKLFAEDIAEAAAADAKAAAKPAAKDQPPKGAKKERIRSAG